MPKMDYLEDPHGEAAIEWMVEMGSGTMPEGQSQAFEAWLRSDPANEAAWIRLQEGLMPYGVALRNKLTPGLIAAHPHRDLRSRRSVLAAFAVLGAGAAGGGILNRFLPLNGVFADHVTFTAQQEHVRLADGSELVLAPRTVLNVRYRPGLRRVELLDGACLVRAASRSTPFEAEAGPVTLRTDAGVFMLENRAVQSATGIQGTGELAVPGTGRTQLLVPGDHIEVEDGHVRRLKTEADVATAWLDGLLVAKDQSLGTLIGNLRPYFPGVIRLDPAIASLRVTGVFSLREPGAALDALAESLDLTLTRVAHYWVALAPGRT